MTPEPAPPQRLRYRRQWASCGGCDARWTSLAWAHCATCHRTFGAVTGFDRHRRRGVCVDPETIPELVLRNGVWRKAMSASSRRQLGIPDQP